MNSTVFVGRCFLVKQSSFLGRARDGFQWTFGVIGAHRILKKLGRVTRLQEANFLATYKKDD
jgi:hypothetical protein